MNARGMRTEMKELIRDLIKRKPNKEQIAKLKLMFSAKHKLKKIPTDFEILLNADNKEREVLKKILKTKPTRTISGVAPLAIMTKPLPCPHGKCIMCPGGPESYFGDVPQSYTGLEPAARRALRNDFDPYLQVFNRLEQYIILGHPVDKTELIIMGGTFPSFNEEYQKEFVAYAYKALNDFSALFFRKNFNFERFKNFFELPRDINDNAIQKRIKSKIKKLKGIADLEKEKKRNEKARIRAVALCIETRPDYCKEKHIDLMLKLGTTRVELGVQSIYDDVLDKINRGHSVEDSVKATKLLRKAFLKVGYHIMIGLPGSSDKRDIEMFRILFSDERFRPDFLKIYPCQVIRGTKLYDLWKTGKYKPLTVKRAVEIIIRAKQYVPEYCRIMRVQRDIPQNAIDAGVIMTNLRQYIHQIMARRNLKCRCIRCREAGTRIKQGVFPKLEKITYKNLKYKTTAGTEIFISAEDETTDTLFGFCRLRLGEEAGIRELHVFGEALPLKDKSTNKVQHRGIGKKLVRIAERTAKNRYREIKIISGIGVREYYRKLGYRKQGYYMVKKL